MAKYIKIMKIASTDRLQPIETEVPRSNLERKPASTLPKAFLPLDPSILQGLDQEGIDQLVPTYALKGTAVDGGPKWSWVDAWGFRWEVRFHPYANTAFSSQPSGCGSSIRFGMQVVPGAFGDEEILSMDQELVEIFGSPSQSEQAHATQYVDKFGFIYFDIHGEIVGLYSDEGHIKGTGNFWHPSFAMSLEEFLQMPGNEITIYREILELLQRDDSRAAAHSVEVVLVDWVKELIKINHSNNPRRAGDAFLVEKFFWFWWCSLLWRPRILSSCGPVGIPPVFALRNRYYHSKLGENTKPQGNYIYPVLDYAFTPCFPSKWEQMIKMRLPCTKSLRFEMVQNCYNMGYECRDDFYTIKYPGQC